MAVTGSAAEGQPASLVMGLGDGTSGARSFASATGRRLLCVDTPDALLAHLRRGQGSVTVSVGSSLDVRQLHQLTCAALESGTRVGFIAGWGGPTDAERHAEKLATYAWSDKDTVLVWSDTNLPELRPGRYGGARFTARTDDGLFDEIRDRHRVTALITHGNGVDASLGRGFLCSATGAGATPDDTPYLPCGFPEGPCIRSDRIDGRLLPPPRLSPREVSADVVIWSSCYGVLAPGAPYDPARALASEFARSGATGALLATYKDSAEDLWPVLLALGLLAEGQTLGDICLELNRRTVDLGDGDPPWLLLGDPDVAFPATRPLTRLLPEGADRVVRLAPGINHLQLPSRQPHVVTVEPAGTDGQAAVMTCQVPASSSLLVVHHGGAGPPYRLRAAPADRDERFVALRSIRSTLAPLVFSRSVVEQAAKNPRAKELSTAALQAALDERLNRHVAFAKTSTPYELAARLSGSGGQAAQHDREIDTWKGLNNALALFLASYSLVAGTINTLGSTRGEPLAPGRACSYCGMPVSRREAWDPRSGTRRRIRWCAGCALLSDTSDAVEDIRLTGPTRIRPGSTHDFTLDFDGAISNCWRVLHACLRPQPTPWPLECSGPVGAAVVQPGQPFPTVELKLTLKGSIPVGVYYLNAAVAAHGDLWTCRRPVVVEPGA